MSSSTALRCERLTKRYGSLVAVDQLTLEVERGECLGLLGPNGAGKTTTVEMFEGLTRADDGVIEVLGYRWDHGNDRILRDRIGVQLQETRLSERLTVLETVRLFRSFYRKGQEPLEVVAMLGLEAKRDARVGKLSGGQRQRVALSCALVGRPELLFLDEPTTGLDPQARLHLWEIVETYRQGGGTVVLTTHYMEEAARLCDRVAVIDQGQLMALDTPSHLIAALGGQQLVDLHTVGQPDLALLGAIDGVHDVRRADEGYRLATTDIGQALGGILAELSRQGIAISSLTTHEATLEDVFVALTGKGLRDG